MARAGQTHSKRTKLPFVSSIATTPASVMWPRLAVIVPALALIAVGVVMVYSASSIEGYVNSGDATTDAVHQVLFAAAGIVLMIAIWYLNSRFAILHNPVFIAVVWAVCLVLVIAVMFVGVEVNGAKRWLGLGSFTIQPSEFMKVAIILAGAYLIAQLNEGTISGPVFAALYIVAAFVPIGFIIGTQSDLGTTMVCLVGVIGMLFFAGLRGRWLVVALGLIAIVGVVAIVMKPYRLARILTFLDPWADADGDGYQIIHSLQALASGGLTGVGIGNSYEKMLYLPEPQTDFIFAVIGEEMGFVGTFCIVVAFVVILGGAYKIASDAMGSGNLMGLLVAATLATILVFQALLNIYCVSGWAPLTGKTLPFLSAGGTSMITSCAIVGIIMAVSCETFPADKSAQRAAARQGNLRVVSTYGPSANRAEGLSGQSARPVGRPSRNAGSIRSNGGGAYSRAARSRNTSATGSNRPYRR